jgi:SAM-dependent methyltransferase
VTSVGTDFRDRFADLLGHPVASTEIDLEDFAEFKDLYRDQRNMIDNAKMLEYYVSFRWLDLGPDDTYIDIAAQDCPFAFFVRDHFGSRAYRQDLFYLAKGIHGEDIGGNAARIPLPDGSVSKMSLHNSLEHFEGRSDIRFFKEAQRLLRPGGKLLVVPLFIADTYSTVKDAGWVDEEGVKHLWGEGARFARWYDLPHFKSRILDKSPQLGVEVYHVDNAAAVDPQCFPYFALFERLGQNARGRPC